jgi:ribonuclease P protein component
LGVIRVRKELRLTRNDDFQKVYRFGKSAANYQFVVYYRPNQAVEKFRLGVSVSKKIGNAVVRNRVRRKIKEIVRLSEEQIKPHIELILIVRKPAAEMDYASLQRSVVHVLNRAGIYMKPGGKK